MLEILKEISPQKTKYDFNKQSATNFDFNILYMEYTEKGIDIKNLTEGFFEEGFEKDPSTVFIENISSIPYFSELYLFLSEQELDFKMAYESLSVKTLLDFELNGFKVDARMQGNPSPFGPSGPNGWIPEISYYSAVSLKNFFAKFIAKHLNLVKQLESKKRTKKQEKYIDFISEIGDPEEIASTFEKYDKNIIQEELELLHLSSTKPLLIISNYFYCSKFNMTKIKEDLLEYHKVLNQNDSLVPMSASCSICGTNKELENSNLFALNSAYSSKVFNLNIKKHDNKKIINQAAFFCSSCSMQLNMIQNVLQDGGNYRFFIFDKITKDIKGVRSLKELSNDLENNRRLSVFELKRHENGSKDPYFLDFLFELIVKDSSLLSFNFNLIQVFLLKPINSLTPWTTYLYSNKDSGGDFCIYQSSIFKSNRILFRDLWLYDKKISVKALSGILFEMLRKINISNSETKYLRKLFEISKEVDIIKEITGEKDMFTEHSNINRYLDLLDQDELEEFKLIEFSDSEFWGLFGAALGYIYSKDKSKNSNLSYLSDFKFISNKKLYKKLERGLELYGYSISQKQKKFKTVLSYLLSEVLTRPVTEETKISLISGILNTGTIKLIKKIKTGENNE